MVITENDRLKITQFLQWEDKEGHYTDECCALEEVNIMSNDEAGKFFFGVINTEMYFKIVDNIFEIEFEEAMNYAKVHGFYDTTVEKLELLRNCENPTSDFYQKLLG